MTDHSYLQKQATPDRLDQFNYRSDARRLGREYYDDELDSEREIHSFIAHYADLLANDIIPGESKVKTTLHNERVIITRPTYRNPLRKYTYLVTLREDLHYAPSGKRDYVSAFRDAVARYICEVARGCIAVTEGAMMEQAETDPVTI